MIPRREQQVFSLGGVYIGSNAKGNIVINPPFNPNEFGRKMGYKLGDELYAINGKPLTVQNYADIIDEVKAGMKEGETLAVKIGRLNSNNTIDTMTLSAPVAKVTLLDVNKLALMTDASPKQLLVQKAWLTPGSAQPKERPVANATDVNNIDAIIKATYSTLSGPAGQRDWNRFYSLFLPEAEMGATVRTADGKKTFKSFTPEEYKKMNSGFLMQSGFYEEELKRNMQQYGNVATVQSSYQFRFAPDGKVQQRGVNYFTLVQSNGRWWIANLAWQDEDKNLPLPAELEKKTM
jgi:hypothetical protein